MEFKLLTKKETKSARTEFHKIKNDVAKLLKEKYDFIIKDSGSNEYNFNIRNNIGQYDLDYLMILTEKSKSQYYKDNSTEIRREIFQAFQDVVKKEEYNSYKTEQSTSVITLIKIENYTRTWSYDICIAKEISNNKKHTMQKIVRNSIGNNNDGGNAYTWNELGPIDKSEKWFQRLMGEERKKEKQKIIERKRESKKIGDKNHPNYKTTSQILSDLYNESQQSKNNQKIIK